MGRSKPRTNKRPPPKPRQLPPPPLDFTSYPPPVDPTDPTFPSALHNWSTSALSRLDALPKLTQSQLSAIAGAAAGVGDGTGLIPGMGANGLPIDLPSSLAQLFEAKLTLDREKEKLVRMQKELKGYREGVAAVNTKGKEVSVEQDCTCAGHSHSYPASAHSEEYYSDEYEFYDCDCDCHYIECPHVEGEECDCEVEEEHDHHHHHHDDYGDHEHTCDHDEGVIPNPYLKAGQTPGLSYAQALEQYQGERDAAARGLDEVGGLLRAKGWDDRKPLNEDPRRLDEAVRELFNWIKAVVWTIEQAAIVAGRRGLAPQEAR